MQFMTGHRNHQPKGQKLMSTKTKTLIAAAFLCLAPCFSFGQYGYGGAYQKADSFRIEESRQRLEDAKKKARESKRKSQESMRKAIKPLAMALLVFLYNLTEKRKKS